MRLCHLSEIWMLKMGLVRAQLMEAELLILNEPTCHLKRSDAQWLIEYINSLKTLPKPVTVLATSHDPQYLESTTTHILEFENQELEAYEGGMASYLARHASLTSCEIGDGPPRKRCRAWE